MVASTIAAVRGDRASSYRILALSHAAGLLTGATALMALLVGLGALIGRIPGASQAIAGVAAIFALIWGTAAIGWKPLAVPSRRWQVPLAWRYLFRPTVHLYWYGVGLGLGFLTQLRTLSLYVCATCVLVLAVPMIAVIVAIAYAGARVFPVVGLSIDDDGDSEGPVMSAPKHAWMLRLDASLLAAAGLVLVLTEVRPW
jgi:hypothetical protein